MKNKKKKMYVGQVFSFVFIVHLIFAFIFFIALKGGLNIIHPILAIILGVLIFYPIVYFMWAYNRKKVISEIIETDNILTFQMIDDSMFTIPKSEIKHVEVTISFLKNSVLLHTKEGVYLFTYVSKDVIDYLKCI